MMFICALLVPGVMLLFGWMFRVSPPEQINDRYGYRTKRSKSSIDAWNFAHRYAGGVWQKWGLWTLAVSIAAMLLLIGQGDTRVCLGGLGLMIAQLIPMVAVIPITERALKKRFDPEGNPIAGKSS